MACTSRIYTSPSFNMHSSNTIADIADRVVHELLSENGFHDGDDFSFSDEDNQPESGEVNTNSVTETVNQTEAEAPDEDEHEFEFPVVCTDSNSCEISTELVSEEKISPRYPLFDRSLLSDVDLSLRNGDSKPAPATRPSLMKLFSEDRDAASSPTSTSSSESDDLDGVAPETYCVWTPKTDPHPPRGKHKKSNSISIGNTSNRWKVRDLLKRSLSDDNYSVGKDAPVFLFVPPISPEKVNKNEKTGKLGSVKTEKKLPAYKSKIGNIHLPPYLPYRQDQLAAYANFTGSNKNQFHY